MLSSPSISIITVCYNAEQTIARTLRSVAEQSYPHIEYIIIDGGSQDKTLELVSHYAHRAIVISERDEGIYDAMNKGLSRASGHYVWFLNAGDALPTPQIVEEVASLAFANDLPDIIYGDCLLINQEDKILGERRLRPPHTLSWRSFEHGMLVCHQSFVAKRSLCPAYDRRYRFSADVDWCIRVMQKATSYFRIDKPLSLYLNEGATTRNHLTSLRERFLIMTKHYGFVRTLYRHLEFLLRRQR